jgi:phospholipid/cholesterol/gamma-HCH transport system substrate-binding protein
MIQPQMIDRDATDRALLVRRAVVGLVVVALLGTLVLAWGRGMFADRVKVSAVVDDAGGALTVGSDVKSRGVILGEVTSITATDGGVRIGMTLEGKQARRVPATVEARVIAATVFGTTSVDLVLPEGAPRTGQLKAGQVIQQDRSSKTLELQDSLDSTDRVLKAVEPAKLATTLTSIANAVRGKGKRLGGTLETLDTYLARLEPHLPLLQEDLRLAAIDLRTLADVSPDLLDATQDGLTTTRTIVDRRRELADTLKRSHRLVATADTFVRAERQHIVDVLANSAVAFDALYDERSGLAGGFRSFVEFAKLGSAGFSDGPFLQTDVYIKTGGDKPYTAADCPRFGEAAGDNCPGGGSSPKTGTVSAPTADPDAGLIDRIAGILSNAGSAR